jgi:hypothetical protein
VTNRKNQIDLRPFQSKADCERVDTLEAQYRKIAIPEVAAAVQQRGDRTGKDPADEQMR